MVELEAALAHNQRGGREVDDGDGDGVGVDMIKAMIKFRLTWLMIHNMSIWEFESTVAHNHRGGRKVVLMRKMRQKLKP